MSKQLQASPAYRAYVALGNLPAGSTEFEKDDDGNVIVEFGELYCRFHLGREMCGKVFKSSGALKHHLKGDHKVQVLAADKTGNPSNDKIAKARDFYVNMIEHHENALTTASQSIPAPTPTAPPSRSRHNQNASATRSEPDYNLPPARLANRFELPVHTRANKKLNVKKDDIHCGKMNKMVKDAGGKIPCDFCKQSNPKACEFSVSCTNVNWFKGWDDDEDEEIV